MCLRWAINWEKDQNFDPCWFECDAEIVVNCCLGFVKDTSIDSKNVNFFSHLERGCFNFAAAPVANRYLVKSLVIAHL